MLAPCSQHFASKRFWRVDLVSISDKVFRLYRIFGIDFASCFNPLREQGAKKIGKRLRTVSQGGVLPPHQFTAAA